MQSYIHFEVDILIIIKVGQKTNPILSNKKML